MFSCLQIKYFREQKLITTDENTILTVEKHPLVFERFLKDRKISKGKYKSWPTLKN